LNQQERIMPPRAIVFYYLNEVARVSSKEVHLLDSRPSDMNMHDVLSVILRLLLERRSSCWSLLLFPPSDQPTRIRFSYFKMQLTALLKFCLRVSLH